MKFKVATLIIVLIISVSVLTRVTEHTPSRIISNNINNSPSDSRSKIKYDFNIKFPRSYPSAIGVYELSNKEINIVDARIYGGLFNYKTECLETDESFNYEDINSTLTISKNGSLITYKSKQLDMSDKKITKEEAKMKSEKFIKDTFKSLPYEQAETKLDSANNEYIVKFINTLEGKKNYAHPTTAILDIYGNIKKVYYHKNSYIKKASVKIITMQKAAELLLTEASDTNKDTSIDVKKAELVYISDENLIIPAYLFIGEQPNGNVFEQTIPAYKETL